MTKNKFPQLEDLSEDAEALYDVFKNEKSDLACALIAASYLDQILGSLLEQYFIESNITQKVLDPSNGVLGTSMSRIDICYCLGFISKGLHANLATVARLRNKFAHKHQLLSFNDEEVKNLVNSLTFPKMKRVVIGQQGTEQEIDDPLLSIDTRLKFCIIVVQMVNALFALGKNTKRVVKMSNPVDWTT